MAEIVIAIGFIAIITTSLLAVAGKGLELSGREVDISRAYQHCETLMEQLAFEAGRAETWDALAPQLAPQYPTTAGGVEDREFCYTVAVADAGAELKRVQVRVYIARGNSAAAAADSKLPKGGEVLRMTNFLARP
jgi:hypothetical protein